MSFKTLQEAATYARFACAAYAVQQYEDVQHRKKREKHGDDPDEDIEAGDAPEPTKEGGCCASGCCCCGGGGGGKAKTADDVRQCAPCHLIFAQIKHAHTTACAYGSLVICMLLWEVSQLAMPRQEGRQVLHPCTCRTIAEVAGIKPEEILYFSPSNHALAHLPYMIALDKCAFSPRPL